MLSPKILVVEDEIIVGESIRSRLNSLGYTTPAVVVSGDEAIQKAEEILPDLVLMDIRLTGEIDGVEAAAQIRDRFDIPVVYLTAYADNHTLQRAKITEPYGYILKPFEMRELQTTIEMALYKHDMARKLRERERWFATTLKSIGDAVIATDVKGLVTFMNPIAEALTGWKQEDASGEHVTEVFQIVDEETGKSAEHPVMRALREGVVITLGNHNFALVAKDRKEIPIDDSAAPIRDEKEEITGSVMAFRDVAEHRRAENALEKSEAELSAILENAPVFMILMDGDRRVRKLNHTVVEFTGRSESEMIGLRGGEALRCAHALDDPKGCGFGPSCEECPVRRAVLDTFETGKSHRNVEATLPIDRGQTQEEMTLLASTTLVSVLGDQMAIVCLENITERKRAEKQLRDSREQLRALAARLISVREEERRSIAREIHDELGHALTALKMDLSWLDRRISEADDATSSLPLKERTATMANMLDSTIETLRRVASQLRPGILDDLGLAAAVEWQAEDWGNWSGIECELIGPRDDFALDKERATAVFRIFQEILTNVTRHANATSVGIRLELREDDLLLEVNDNGKGITEREISNPKSLGILGMRERANLLGGEVHISGESGKGTTVSVRIPLGDSET